MLAEHLRPAVCNWTYLCYTTSSKLGIGSREVFETKRHSLLRFFFTPNLIKQRYNQQVGQRRKDAG